VSRRLMAFSLGSFLACASLCAEGDRSMAALAPPSDGTIERLMDLPHHADDDAFYKTYFSQPDDGIARNYQNAWRYHEIQTQYAPLQTTTQFYAMAPMTGPGALSPVEKDVRAGFAQSVLRLRMDTALRSAIAPVGVPRAARQHLQTVQGGLNKIKNASVAFSPERGAPRLQMGYDVFSDASKVEVVTERWGAGIYHAHLMGCVSGANVAADAFALRVTTSALALATASLAYLPNGKAVQAAFSRPLSRRVTAQLSTSQPVVPTGYSSYSLSFVIGLRD
jgi:hypothetical protein